MSLFVFLKKMQNQKIEGEIEILDINSEMIKYCREKMINKNLLNKFQFTVAKWTRFTT